MAEQSIQAGVQEAWWMFYDSNGEPSGSTPIALADGASSGAYKLKGIQESPSPVPESESVSIDGDDTSLGAIDFSSAEPREFLLNFGLMDLTFEALLQNTLVETLGSISIGMLDTDTPFNASGALIIQGRAVIEGQAGFSGWIYPLVQLKPLGRESASGRTAATVRYKAVAQMAFYNPWGVTTTDKNGAQRGAYARPFKAAHPITMHAFRGSITSFTLDRSPATLASTHAWSVPDKAKLTVSSINTPTPRLLTLSGAQPATRSGLALYEYE